MRIRTLSLPVILLVITMHGCNPKEAAPAVQNPASPSQETPDDPDFDGDPLSEDAKDDSSAGEQSGGAEESAPQIQDIPDMLQGKTPDDIIALMNDDEYVVYYGENWSGWHTQNLHLLEEWIDKYRRGEPGTVCLLRERAGGSYNAMFFLESDGSASYTMYLYEFDTWVHCTSSVILKREVDYVFASDLPAEEWYDNHWQRTIVVHTPILVDNASFEDYDVEAAAPLGDITPEKAGEIAVYRDMQYATYRKASKTGNTYGAGVFFPLETEPLPINELLSASVELDVRPILFGAAQVNGHPCYKIGITYTPEQTGEGNLVLVNADGGNLVFEISAAHGTYRLSADANQERIIPWADLHMITSPARTVSCFWTALAARPLSSR